jgi:hypothetical protein
MSAVGAPLRPKESRVSTKLAVNQAVVIAFRDAAEDVPVAISSEPDAAQA